MECRKKNNISIAEMAFKLGISQQEYENIEKYKSEIGIEMAVNFALATKTKMEEIYFFNPEIQLN